MTASINVSYFKYLSNMLSKMAGRVPRDYLYESVPRSDNWLKRTCPGLYYYLSLRPVHRLRRHLHASHFLISYPKCGRTWLRLLLGKALADHFCIETDDLLSLKHVARSREDIPRIRVVHEDNPDYKSPTELDAAKREFADKKVIFLVRDPRDVVVSIYYQQKYREDYPWEVPDLSDFLRKERGSMATILAYYNTWMDNRSVPEDFLLVRYEDMQEDTLRELKRTVRFCGLGDIPEKTLRRAVEFARFDNMRSMEEDEEMDSGGLSPGDPENESSYKTRKGKVGGYREDLSAEDIAFLDDMIEDKLTPELGYSGNT